MATRSRTIMSAMLTVLVAYSVGIDLRSAEVASHLAPVEESRAVPSGTATASESQRSSPKPYRVLVIIGDQWDDPGSYVIDGRSRFSDLARMSGKDFLDVVTMLKIWGIPFDVLRLDQQRLQINRFLNGVAEPNYACVIWMADPDKLRGFSANYATLRRAVEDHGMSLIALFDYIKTPEVAALVGVDFREVVEATAEQRRQGLKITGKHFISEGTVGTAVRDEAKSELSVIRCAARPGTVVLGTLGDHPQLSARDFHGQAKAVWIGGGRDWFGRSAVMRRLFRNALVHAIGYGLFNDNFENAYIFIMDDMGASEHAYSLRWHYLGTDRVVQFSIPELCPQQVTCHDLDLVERTDGEITSPERDVRSEPAEVLLAARVVGGRRIDLRSNEWIESKKHKRWIGFNEYCAYLHSRIEVTVADGLDMRFDYDPHYCRHFAGHSSRWTLELSDRYLERFAGDGLVTVDEKRDKRGITRRQTLELSPGVGSRHVIIRVDGSGHEAHRPHSTNSPLLARP